MQVATEVELRADEMLVDPLDRCDIMNLGTLKIIILLRPRLLSGFLFLLLHRIQSDAGAECRQTLEATAIMALNSVSISFSLRTVFASKDESPVILVGPDGRMRTVNLN